MKERRPRTPASAQSRPAAPPKSGSKGKSESRPPSSKAATPRKTGLTRQELSRATSQRPPAHNRPGSSSHSQRRQRPAAEAPVEKPPARAKGAPARPPQAGRGERPAERNEKPRPSARPARPPEAAQEVVSALTVWGRRTVFEHLRSGSPINRLYVLTSARGLSREFFELAQERAIPVVRTDKERLDALSHSGNHQGVVAQLGARSFATSEEVVEAALKARSGLWLALSGVQDPGNLGAILRSAEGAGVQGVLLSARDSCGLTPTVSKVSAGADAHLAVARADRLDRELAPLKEAGFQIVATVPGAKTSYFTIDFTRPTVLVMGGEGEGAEARLLKIATHQVAIPMLGKIHSLNVAAAAAAVLFEAVRQRA